MPSYSNLSLLLWVYFLFYLYYWSALFFYGFYNNKQDSTVLCKFPSSVQYFILLLLNFVAKINYLVHKSCIFSFCCSFSRIRSIEVLRLLWHCDCNLTRCYHFICFYIWIQYTFKVLHYTFKI